MLAIKLLLLNLISNLLQIWVELARIRGADRTWMEELEDARTTMAGILKNVHFCNTEGMFGVVPADDIFEWREGEREVPCKVKKVLRMSLIL